MCAGKDEKGVRGATVSTALSVTVSLSALGLGAHLGNGARWLPVHLLSDCGEA